MKITVEPLDKIIRLTGAEDSSGLRMALTHLLVSVWDQGYNEGFSDAKEMVKREEENSILANTTGKKTGSIKKVIEGSKNFEAQN